MIPYGVAAQERPTSPVKQTAGTPRSMVVGVILAASSPKIRGTGEEERGS